MRSGCDPRGVPVHIALTELAIDTQGVVAALKAGEDGAVTVFDGIVRNHTKGRRTMYLDYTAYEAMAGADLEEGSVHGWRGVGAG